MSEKSAKESGDGSTSTQSGATSDAYERLNELDLNDLMVETKDLSFTYDSNKGDLFNKVNLTFPRGAIYGFLGPSGCGKTTIIKLIIGHLKPSSGSIRIGGKPQKDPSIKIPGNGIGYMPQEYALYSELTIMETLSYFARIYGLSTEHRKKRIEFLIKFLDLPDPNRLTGVLSGGQKRRTSLAIALVHNPQFLILDEPTVGVDPMLRERIWKHLLYLSANEKTSIMITTHYIDECQRAHIIGLMRQGKLLVENTPRVLLQHFGTNNLEDVFLQVCKSEEHRTRPNLPPNLAEVRKTRIQKKKKKKDKKVWSDSSNSSFCGRYYALLIKNAKKLFRQKVFIFALIATPLIATVLICTTIGAKPRDLKVAVYNQELELDSKGLQFSVKLLNKINKQTIVLENYKSNASALDSVRDGHTFGALIVNKEFSNALVVRLGPTDITDVGDDIIKNSTIQFFADTTDLMIFQALFQTLREAEVEFIKDLIEKDFKELNPNANTKVLKPIVLVNDPPVYGSVNPEFRDFTTPGLLILGVYLISMATTTLEIVGEKVAHTLDRTLVAGVHLIEILLSLVTIQCIILIAQTITMMLLVFEVFHIKNEGSYALIFSLVVLQGIHGMSFGLFISAISNDELMALELCVGIFLPFLIISGIIWPLEGMHYILRTISLFTPQTVPIMSLRNIVLKGWGLQHTLVWSGFFTAFGFFVLFIILSTIFSKFI